MPDTAANTAPSAPPRIVTIGGGHGMSALLNGLMVLTPALTAFVPVADVGGTRGRVRRELGLLPPGDFRMCLTALAREEGLVTQLMQYRFASGDGLRGHNFGNIFIAALAEFTGSFERALAETSKVLNIVGRILPSTLVDVTLCGERRSGLLVRGESALAQQGDPLERVWLEPSDPPAMPDTVNAILSADMVVLGPGSLYTSVMPNLLVPGIAQAIRHTRARRVYVCNVAAEQGETDGYSIGDHLAAIERHIGRDTVDMVLANCTPIDSASLPPSREVIVPNMLRFTSSAMGRSCWTLRVSRRRRSSMSFARTTSR